MCNNVYIPNPDFLLVLTYWQNDQILYFYTQISISIN